MEGINLVVEIGKSIWRIVENSPVLSGITVLLVGFVGTKLYEIRKEKHTKEPPTTEPLPDLGEEIKQIEGSSDIALTAPQKFIVEKVNRIHEINAKLYDFTEDFKTALYRIEKKDREWYYAAAGPIANSIQGLGAQRFFSCFDKESLQDPAKEEEFQIIKDQIKYIYSEILQPMRHNDKNNELKRELISKFEREVMGRKDVSDEIYEAVFKKYEDLLFDLLNNFDLKDL